MALLEQVIKIATYAQSVKDNLVEAHKFLDQLPEQAHASIQVTMAVSRALVSIERVRKGLDALSDTKEVQRVD